MYLSPEDLARKIDHTLLKPNADQKEIDKIIEEGIKYNFRAICIPPMWIEYAKKKIGDKDIRIATVVGFPLGYVPTQIKIYEAKKYVELGADDIDVVMNISAFKSGWYEYVREEVKQIVEVAKPAIVKVIIGVDYLTSEEIKKAAELVIEGGAEFVKTNTGFGLRGVEIEDVKLIKESIGDKAKIKAAGGIRTAVKAIELLKAGADVLGTSTGVKILEEYKQFLSKQL